MKSNLVVHYLCICSFFFCFTYESVFAQERWFVFSPQDYFATQTLDLSHWLDAPAGKHGFVQMKGKDLIFQDGTPIKFWGTNIASHLPFMPKEQAQVWAKFLAKYGFNAVRFHKFTWDATDGKYSTLITEENWKNFDFLCQELRKTGIYYGWSHIYGHRIRSGDSTRLLAYKELADTKFPWSHLNATTASLVNFAEDLQNLNIELTVNMLNHKNPLTGLRYADDPALSFIELQNEDNIFWSAIEETLKQTPTYRALLCKKFSQWLLKKYYSQENLEKAWNREGIKEGEHLGKENIYPTPNHGLFSWEYEQAIKNKQPVKQHILDKIAFLYEEQIKFYNKFVAAIRATGYKGTIVGSCWQAGTGISHLYNLYADYQVGIIDRHNYFGGGQGHDLKAGKFDNSSMLSQVGSGLLGTGLQQVSDRPFAISEWMSLIPNEWTAESAPLLAVYGMGLQGWDASYTFATDYPHFTETIQTPPWGGIYNACSPTQLALYPALAMMIYRNDVKEGETIANRNVHLPSMLENKQFLNEKTVQDHDRKSFTGDFPLEAMAIGKVSISFTDKLKENEIGEIQKFCKGKTVSSNTQQLFWDYSVKGFFTINTSGTKGLVGFAKDKLHRLGEVDFSTSNEFAVILVNSLDKQEGLDKAKRWLITTVARAKNTGMEYDAEKKSLLKVGTSPILIEPVKVNLKINKKAKYKVYPLDHVGNRRLQEIPISKHTLVLDGEKYQAIYYEIVFE
ncbi:hypothetical protein [Thermoflexibacter ruber]|uniref:Beta-galactosidase n=1 Tax=Thermoflexibacter ruber TaxID=1003 RepID=A0A1I2DQ55_9BACT|nr:hypothetical protein [Thermoflexibacter ruber]SFE82608.1 hypothetical protein SAMN04488541_1007122 [Thermoflexibacter ruber]